jgi:pimeloyl-ACP methyl ester carboxylesterase
MRNDYVAPIADAFSQAGLAVLSWDRPGCGNSTGDWQRQNVDERAVEASTAVQFLQQRTDIDSRRVGLWGLSQGANVASLAGGQSDEVAFIVAVSPAGITMAELQVYGLAQQMLTEGISQEQIDAAVRCAQAIQEASRRGDRYAELEAAVLNDARMRPWWRFFSVVPNKETWDFLRLRGGFPDLDRDQAATWERVRCPVLAIWGERDTTFPISEVIARTDTALARSFNADVTIRVFPDAEHGIKLVESSEFAPGYLELIVSWTRERVGLV